MGEQTLTLTHEIRRVRPKQEMPHTRLPHAMLVLSIRKGILEPERSLRTVHLPPSRRSMTTISPGDLLAAQAVEHLRALVRLDTTNPPGNEIIAAEYVARALGAAGIAVEVVESAPGRGNVVARLRAPVETPEPALLLHGHLDVVPAREADGWTHAPFSGDLVDGYIWGRAPTSIRWACCCSNASPAGSPSSDPPRRR